MTPEQIALVQQSFAKVLPISEQAAKLFYDRLFEIAPELKAMFHTDMDDQGRKLMATLAVVVAGMSRFDNVLPTAKDLAKRHVNFGVTPSHYAPVGAALLWTLEHTFGPAWTPELASAWTAAYTTLSGFMIEQAYGRGAAA